jgi:hypothetical protein
MQRATRINTKSDMRMKDDFLHNPACKSYNHYWSPRADGIIKWLGNDTPLNRYFYIFLQRWSCSESYLMYDQMIASQAIRLISLSFFVEQMVL